MCGIWYCLSDLCTAASAHYIAKIQGRGPEGTRSITLPYGGTMGFNRLAINGLNPEGMQPM